MDRNFRRAVLAHCSALFLSCASCIGAKGNDHYEVPLPAPDVAYVSPTGSDTAAGARATPFRTLTKALAGGFQRITLLRGAHEEPRIEIGRGVTIEGDGPVVIRGHVFVTGNGVTLRRVSLGDGLRAHFVENLRVDNATIAAGSKDDAASITRASASFAHVKFACGVLSCLESTTATITIHDSIATGGSETKRIMRFDMSRAQIVRVRMENGSIAQLQLGAGSHVEVSDLKLTGGSTGVIAAQGSSLVASKMVVEGASKMALVGQRAKLRIEDSTFGSTLDQTIDLSGVDASFRRLMVEGSAKGAIGVSDHLVSKSKVSITGGEIRHGRATAILLDSGEVVISDVKFVGEAKARSGEDAIIARGVDAKVTISPATFEAPAGFAVSFHSDASGTVTATITEPRLGGVLVDDVATEQVMVTDSVLRKCADGSGVVVQQAKATVLRTRVEDCSEAGVLAGDKAHVRISNSLLMNNRMYGFAAFGGASVEVNGTRIRGSKFATFASCGDGARIDDAGNNRFEGSVSSCP